MNCVTIQSLLFDYSRGRLSSETTIKVEKHLECCSRCRVVSESFSILAASQKVMDWFDKYRKNASRELPQAA